MSEHLWVFYLGGVIGTLLYQLGHYDADPEEFFDDLDRRTNRPLRAAAHILLWPLFAINTIARLVNQ